MHNSGSVGSQNGSMSSDNIDSSGLTWLQQQQMKLNQRQRTRDDVDSAQVIHTYVFFGLKTCASYVRFWSLRLQTMVSIQLKALLIFWRKLILNFARYFLAQKIINQPTMAFCV